MKASKDKCGIYRIYCKKNRQYYVGSSYQIYTRWSQHRLNLRTNKHTSPYLQHAWNKYGEASFTFKVLEECDKDILHEQEQFWIDKLKPKFNSILIISPRQQLSEETKAKMSASHQASGKHSEAQKLRWQQHTGVENSLGALAAGRAFRLAHLQNGVCKRGHPHDGSGDCRQCENEVRRQRYAPHPKPVKLFCKNGHPRTPDSTDTGGGCRTCRQLQQNRPKSKLCADCCCLFVGKRSSHYCPDCLRVRQSEHGKAVAPHGRELGFKHSYETRAKMSETAKAQNRVTVNKGSNGRIIKQL